MRRTKEEAQKTREQLLISAKKLFTEKGFSSTALSDIVQNAGLTRGAAYWHFKNKDEIYIAVVQQALSDMMAAKEAALNQPLRTPREKLQSILCLPLNMPTEYALVNGVAALLPTCPQFAELEEIVQNQKKNLKQSIRLFLEECLQEDRLSLRADIQTTVKMFFLLFEGLYFHDQEKKDISPDDLFQFLGIMCDFH